ncbi:hypothetical protein BaRGS_00021124, partial [Batillaria attramentaria]
LTGQVDPSLSHAHLVPLLPPRPLLVMQHVHPRTCASLPLRRVKRETRPLADLKGANQKLSPFAPPKSEAHYGGVSSLAAYPAWVRRH